VGDDDDGVAVGGMEVVEGVDKAPAHARGLCRIGQQDVDVAEPVEHELVDRSRERAVLERSEWEELLDRPESAVDHEDERRDRLEVETGAQPGDVGEGVLAPALAIALLPRYVAVLGGLFDAMLVALEWIVDFPFPEAWVVLASREREDGQEDSTDRAAWSEPFRHLPERRRAHSLRPPRLGHHPVLFGDRGSVARDGSRELELDVSRLPGPGVELARNNRISGRMLSDAHVEEQTDDLATPRRRPTAGNRRCGVRRSR